jgi:ribulose-bisphosphate carboxylase large chain
MSVERAGEMLRMYGDDAVFLLGGSLLRAGDRIGEAIAAMRTALERHAAEGT